MLHRQKPSEHPGPIFRTVRVRADRLPAQWGTYQRGVLESGHVPGVLSGAALKGSARAFGGRYARNRAAVEAWARENLGIVSGRVLRGDPPRVCRVWTDYANGQPVRIEIDHTDELEASA